MVVMSFFEMKNSETSSKARVALVRVAEGRSRVMANGSAGEGVGGRVTVIEAAALYEAGMVGVPGMVPLFYGEVVGTHDKPGERATEFAYPVVSLVAMG